MMYFGEPSASSKRCSLISQASDDDNNNNDISDDDQSQKSVIYLPADFLPGPNDVVCARGKSYWDHEGNQKYRKLIAMATEKYKLTSNKLEKTLIVSDICAAVHKSKGKFVKKEGKGGPWVQVDEVFAREKIGQSLRDGLHQKYRSSTKAKKERLQKVNDQINCDIDKVIQSNRQVSAQIENLTQQVEKNGALASDYSIMTMFSRANSDILETIKRDSSMLLHFQDATVAANNAAAAANNNASDP